MSTASAIETEIKKLETEIARIIPSLDSITTEFVRSLPSSVESWMHNELKRRIDERAEKILSSGIEQLRAAKADLAILVAQLPTSCTKAAGDKSEWPHNLGNPQSQYPQGTSRESFFAATFRRAIAPLGALLHKHGLLSDRHYAWRAIGNGQFSYAINPGFDADSSALTRYEDLLSQVRRLKESLAERKSALAKAQAQDLWDRA